ncbi:hypothetical protein ACFYUV_38240 [Nonomuraea sp. NPDC003560]|uniref:hypothetical protein n=1 Tax=Nonomuraea sp. NPDC003560 TaxID=3364341 RepID=UPI00367568D3
MAAVLPLLLVLAGGALCAAGERAILDERTVRAIVTCAPGLALIAMGVVVMVFGWAP